MTGASELLVEHLEHRLRLWSDQSDPHVRAAVDLLIDHDVWLRRPEFVTAAVRLDDHDGSAWIVFTAARAAFDTGGFSQASSTERAVLDLAIELGQDRFRFSRMGAGNSVLIQRAVGEALRLPRG